MVKTAVTYVFEGKIAKKDQDKIKDHFINPVDQKEADEDIPKTLEMKFKEPGDIEVLEGFMGMTSKDQEKLYKKLDLAMTFDDFAAIQKNLS